MSSFKYKFYLTAPQGFLFEVNPIYGSDLAKVYKRESGQMFYKEELNGKLIFTLRDYSFIMSQDFDYVFPVTIREYSSDGTYTTVFIGKFARTDCKIDEVNQKIEVSVSSNTLYDKVVAGLEKEFNLIQLAPELEEIIITKRPAVQLYVLGDSVITTWVGGSYFEQSATPVDSEDTLRNTYYFGKAGETSEYVVSGGSSYGIDGSYLTVDAIEAQGLLFRTAYRYVPGDGEMSDTHWIWTEIVRTSDGVVLWKSTEFQKPDTPTDADLQTTGTFTPVNASGSLTIDLYVREVFSRYLLDVDEINGRPTYPIPAEDLTENSANYSRVIDIETSTQGSVFYSTELSSTPTEWGIYQPGQYYVRPTFPISTGLNDANLIPVGKSQWGAFSTWWYPQYFIELTEPSARKEYTLSHAYDLASCINILLREVAPEVSFYATSEYSQFFYGISNPLTGLQFRPFITQNTNILKGEYDNPAQKAMCTLKTIFDMLRDCFQCYWFIDGDKLRIEHIFWFKKGGIYMGQPLVGYDLTTLVNPRTNKPWTYGQTQYEFDKSSLPEWYQFSWANDVSMIFKGAPINILSAYVEEGKIEEVNVGKFVSDVDLMLLNPGAFNEEGFTLLLPVLSGGEYKLPILSGVWGDGSDFQTQNGYASFFALQEYYMFDLPASKVEINGQETTIVSTLNLKKSRKQTITVPFPVTGLDPMLLVNTELGLGSISEAEINLSSKSAKIDLEFSPY